MFTPSDRLIEGIASTLRERNFRLGRLSQGVMRLSEMFVEKNGWQDDYFDNFELLAAYAAYYLPVNALKVRWVLDEMKKYAPDFLSRPLRVLDYGSGPGTALLGLAEASNLEHQAVAVDRVPKALELARDLVKAVTSISLETASIRPPDMFDLIFAINVYVEAEDDHDVLALLEQLDPKGYMILIEPSPKGSTRRLMRLRDRLVAAGVRIAAPCLEVDKCPMLPHKDLWCHMDVRWTRPAFIQKMDDRVGLRKESLKFCYFVVTKEGAGLQGSARIVSNVHKEKGKSWAWLCGGCEDLAKVELLKRHKGEHNADFRRAERGDVLEISEYAPARNMRLGQSTTVRKV